MPECDFLRGQHNAPDTILRDAVTVELDVNVKTAQRLRMRLGYLHKLSSAAIYAYMNTIMRGETRHSIAG